MKTGILIMCLIGISGYSFNNENIRPFLFGFLAIVLPVIFFILLNRSLWRKQITVVVLGDLARSPRMQNHILCLAQNKWKVVVLAYLDNHPKAEITNHPLISLYSIPQVPKFSKILKPASISYAFKTVWMTIALFSKFFYTSIRSHVVLVQNPPSIPTLFLALPIYILGKIFVIDFHNYGYTLLGLSLGNDHSLVKFHNKLEGVLGSWCDASFCVSKAMQRDLAIKWGISSKVLYDLPPRCFQPLSFSERDKFLDVLSEEYSNFSDVKDNSSVLLLSSTSWGDDEDMTILLDALKKYDKIKMSMYPDILCVITGKGPGREKFKELISQHDWQGSVNFELPWVSCEDYPKLLGSADIGVCLHGSSSGLDLPMKVVDMLGSGLPVLALEYDTISELVNENVGGSLFKNSDDLFDLLKPLALSITNENRDQRKRKLPLWENEYFSQALPVINQFGKSTYNRLPASS